MTNRFDVYRLAAHVRCSHRTVERWAVGRGVSGATAYALDSAARELSVDREELGRILKGDPDVRIAESEPGPEEPKPPKDPGDWDEILP